MVKTVQEVFRDRVETKLTESGPNIPDRLGVFSEEPVTDFDLFVGKQNELTALADAIAEALKGNYLRVFLIGETGAGKSSLLSVMLRAYAEGHHSRYLILPFDRRHYYKTNWEKTYPVVIILQLLDAAEKHLKKSARDDKRIEKLYSLRSKILEAPESIKSVDDLYKLAIEEKLCKTGETLFGVIADCLKQKIIFLFDDAQVLVENKALLKEIQDYVKALRAISIFALFPDTYQDLALEKSDFLKAAIAISLIPLSVDEATELLRRRLLIARDKRNQITNPPNYSEELQPFDEAAVQFIAAKTNNPLTFIQKLKLADAAAKNANSDKITLDIAVSIYQTTNKEIFLTPRETEVLAFVNKSGPVTVEDVKVLLNVKSKLSGYFHLQKLYTFKLIDRRKKASDKKTYEYFGQKAGLTRTGENK